MALPILIAVIPAMKVVATAAAASIASVAGRKAGEHLFDRKHDQSAASETHVTAATAAAQQRAKEAEERADIAEQALYQEIAIRRTLARVVLPIAILAGLAAGILIGWLLIP
jgi:hypothetical protein